MATIEELRDYEYNMIYGAERLPEFRELVNQLMRGNVYRAEISQNQLGEFRILIEGVPSEEGK